MPGSISYTGEKANELIAGGPKEMALFHLLRSTGITLRGEILVSADHPSPC